MFKAKNFPNTAATITISAAAALIATTVATTAASHYYYHCYCYYRCLSLLLLHNAPRGSRNHMPTGDWQVEVGRLGAELAAAARVQQEPPRRCARFAFWSHLEAP